MVSMSVMTTAVLPSLSFAVLPSTEQPIQYAHSTCAAGMAELHIQDALPEDDGIYTCLAENTLGQVSCSARVTVHGRSLCEHICLAVKALYLKAGRRRRWPPGVHGDEGLPWEMDMQKLVFTPFTPPTGTERRCRGKRQRFPWPRKLPV